ncbi:MAG TPA: YciI family protein [Usitatibacter sp.]|nr:YciI family protein [Usitatibacter sp.]
MRFVVLVKATKESEAGVMPSAKLLEDMGRFNEELVNAGVMQAGEGLQPSSKGARINFSKDNKRTVVDGPFTETKELVAGFWIWKCKSLDEAIAWARKCPSPHPGQEAQLEVRQVFEAEDFGAEFSPEERAREERVRARLEQGR